MNENTQEKLAAPQESIEVPASLRNDIERILIPRRRIASRVRALAGRIGADFGDKPMMLAAIMTGSLIFVADLIRHREQVDARRLN